MGLAREKWVRIGAGEDVLVAGEFGGVEGWAVVGVAVVCWAAVEGGKGVVDAAVVEG